MVKNLPANEGGASSIPGSGRSLGVGNGIVGSAELNNALAGVF